MNTVEKAKNYIGENTTLALGLIVALIVLVVYLTVYYRGLYGVGPYYVTQDEKNEIEKMAEQLNEAFSK